MNDIMSKRMQSDVINELYCINLKRIRRDRKIFIKRQAKRRNLPLVKFFDAIHKPNNGAKGCLESHLAIIKIAKKKKMEKVMIIEDDCLFHKKFSLPKLPPIYDMLYLGGNVDEVYENNNTPWCKASVWTTHSYIIHSSIYDEVIEGLEKYDGQIDKYYKTEIHSRKKTYILNPQLTTQKAGYSDIEKRKTDYSTMNTVEDVKEIEFASNEITEEKEYILKLDDIPDEQLPGVSILTPTYNRRKFFHLAIHNYKSFIYPRNKLEWIVVDDGTEDISDMLEGIENVKHVKIDSEKKLTIAMKRNMCVNNAKYDFMVHMDDDDYYPPNSVSTRIKILLQNMPFKQCVGCVKLGCWDILNRKSYTITGDKVLSEASLAYTREFHSERSFHGNVVMGEGRLYIKGRQQYCLQIPYPFVLVVLNHGNNITRQLRRANKGEGVSDEKNVFEIDEEVVKIVRKIHEKNEKDEEVKENEWVI